MHKQKETASCIFRREKMHIKIITKYWHKKLKILLTENMKMKEQGIIRKDLNKNKY